ncbi:Tfp pilus assembly protein PilO [Actinoplanes lutulentus]|uniref:Tfp pilus assembly protein PilO n=1 Tax=Actinoplanes lutulentus TaxID=1287878 RepID=A0A327ZGG2_9ACTN|nr:type 4a pilus biogenesis protein PilO [Actinoplanes lutulentus]MBB2947893.1 Tfp pilus assembly protein PilO [Actinoplanes lutulentus]RAK40226.1 Tfp pilus assembly protein PilO [Actinoplanes lutulentus]
MTARRIDSIWLIGGLSLIAVLIIASWFILIKPKYAEADGEREQAGTIAAQVSTLKSKYSQQQKRAENLDQYMTELATYQAALPQSSNNNSIPAFLRELQALGTKLDVDVSGYSAAEPETSDDAGTVTELPITLNASGKTTNLSKFLKQLQNTQPRAVLIESASLTIESSTAASVTLALNAFITSSETVDLDELKKDLEEAS